MEISSHPQIITHHQAENLPTLQDDKQQRILETICKAGELTPLAIAKTGHQYPLLKNLDREAIAPIFGLLFTRIATLVGLKGEIDPLQKQEIWNAVFSRFSGLSFQEIYKSFQMDRSGEFGDVTEHFQFFDVSYVCTVLGKYRQWLQDTQRTHNINISQLAKNQNTMTEEEKEKNVIHCLNEHFEEYKETKAMPFPAAQVYKTLLKRGVLKPYFATLTERDRQLMRSETDKQLRHQQAIAKDKNDFATAKNLISLFQQGETDKDGKILRIKQEVTLQFFYNWLITQGKELSEMLSLQ